jgi:CRP-like cAMP-binding protein
MPEEAPKTVPLASLILPKTGLAPQAGSGPEAGSPTKSSLKKNWGLVRKASFGISPSNNIFTLVRRAQTVQHQCLNYLQLPPAKRGVTEVNTIASYVSILKFFSKLPRYQVKELARCITYQRHPKLEVLFETGDEEMFFYIIFSGSVQLIGGVDAQASEVGADKMTRPLFTLKHGDVFGAMKERDGHREMTAKTFKDTELLVLTKADYMRLLYEDHNKEHKSHAMLLRGSAMFESLKLSEQDLELIAKWTHVNRYPVNTVLARQGDPCFNMFCIKRGEVVTFKRPQEENTPKDDTITIRRLSVMLRQPDAQMHNSHPGPCSPPPDNTISLMRQAQAENSRKTSRAFDGRTTTSGAASPDRSPHSPENESRRSLSPVRSPLLNADDATPIFCVERLGRHSIFGELAAVSGDEKTVRKWPTWVVTSSPVEVLVLSRSIIYRKLPRRLQDILARYANDAPKRDEDFVTGVHQTKVWIKKKREMLLDADLVQAGKIPLKANLRDDQNFRNYHYHLHSQKWVVPSSDRVESLLPSEGGEETNFGGGESGLKLASSSSAPVAEDYSEYSCSTAATSGIFLAQSNSNCFTSFPVPNAPHTGEASRTAGERRDRDLWKLRNTPHEKPGRKWKPGQGWVMDWGGPNPHRYRQEGAESDDDEYDAALSSPLSKQRRERRRRQQKRKKLEQQQLMQQSRMRQQQREKAEIASTGATPAFKLLSLDAPCIAMAAKERREKAAKRPGYGKNSKSKKISKSEDQSTRLLEMQADHEGMGQVATSVPKPKGAMSMVSFGSTYRPRPNARDFCAKNGSSRDSEEEQSGKLTMMHELSSHHQLEEAALLHTLTSTTTNSSVDDAGGVGSLKGDESPKNESSPTGLTRKLSSQNMRSSMKVQMEKLKQKGGKQAGVHAVAKRNSTLNLNPINTVSHFWAPPQIVRKNSVELVPKGSILTRHELISRERRQRDLMGQSLTNSDGVAISLRLAKTAGDLRVKPT